MKNAFAIMIKNYGFLPSFPKASGNGGRRGIAVITAARRGFSTGRVGICDFFTLAILILKMQFLVT